MRTELRKKRIEMGLSWSEAAARVEVNSFEYKVFEEQEGLPLPGFVDKVKQVFGLTEEEMNVKDGKRHDPNDKTPKKVVYRGIEFRSYLEARWAFLFDLAGIEYIYEPDKEFTMSNGKKYWADFLFPNVGIDHSEEKGKYFNLYGEAKGLKENNTLPPDAFYKASEYYKKNRKIINIGNVPPNIWELKDRNGNYCGYNTNGDKTCCDYFWSFRFIDGSDRDATIVFKNGKMLVRVAADLNDIGQEHIIKTNEMFKRAHYLDLSLGPVEVTPSVSKNRQIWEFLEKKRIENIERIKNEIKEFEKLEDSVVDIPASFKYKK